ncbi:DUF4397 domain-containing protein [Pontibacter sp. 13R65]|uniref:DUF4397 domain-containing protein n=1 Tax=Pontibacter sp. 13R65 TaxID=3127458 RepID=UPI00301D3344
MQNPFKKLSFRKGALLCCSLFAAVSLTSCLDDERETPEPIPLSFVSFYQGSPTNQEYDYLVDNQRISNQGLKYTTHSGYLNYKVGDRKIKVNAVNTVNALIDTTLNFQENKFYSLFLAGVHPDVSLIAIHDTVGALSTGKAALRIINLSPDAPGIDISTTGSQATVLATNLEFKEHTEFQVLDATAQTLQVKVTGTEQVLMTNPSVTLTSGKAHTLIIRGFANPPAGNNNTLSAQFMPN